MSTSARLRLVHAPDVSARGSREDDARVRALRAGDAATIDAALLELLPRVRRWLYRLLGPGADLDDAVQDALADITLALPRFEGRAQLSTLAHRITVRVAYRYFGRRRRADTSLEVVPPPASELNPESQAMEREALRRLYRCLDRLPKKRRVAFVLCAVEGMTPGEAADVAGVTAVAMRSRLMHARAEVTRMLRGDPYVAALLERRER